jgi:hypothetical protein
MIRFATLIFFFDNFNDRSLKIHLSGAEFLLLCLKVYKPIIYLTNIFNDQVSIKLTHVFISFFWIKRHQRTFSFEIKCK